jgi:DNA invertase Pin-like site-specific DNA recombinase
MMTGAGGGAEDSVMDSAPDPFPKVARKRCAIYTRKSTEHGLQQDFNTLDAQRAVCSAYIQSQQHRGWSECGRAYEDAAQSGATLERPAMKALLADIERGRVDVVVVYKLDRLSRSLLDFVRLIDVFQRYGVSFVCITQNFDTADSLGRLVMNVLLTFAQFEREMTGDRIRDKKRAMVSNGLWPGGRAPLGYDLIHHHLVINRPEAAIVREVFSLYLEHQSLTAVGRICRRKGYRSKVNVSKDGNRSGGVLLRTASVRKLLMNPVYAGFLLSSGKLSRGVHESIVSVETWERVSALRERQIAERWKLAPPELLGGLIYDCFGRSMTANRLQRRGKIHVHYRSNQSAWGLRHGVKRMRIEAPEADRIVLSAIQHFLSTRAELRGLLADLGRSASELRAACHKAPVASRRLEAISPDQLRSAIQGLVRHVEVSRERIKIVTRALEFEQLLDWNFVGLFRRQTEDSDGSIAHVIDIACAGPVRLERRFRLPIAAADKSTKRINNGLRKLVSDARSAWALVERDRRSCPAYLARQCNMSVSHFMRLLRVSYLAPDIITAILDGAQPPELTRRGLLDANLPLDWALQRKLFGFAEQPPMQSSERY